MAMKSWQKAALALVGTMIALAGAFLWLLGYAMSTCGPNEGLFALTGLGLLAVAERHCGCLPRAPAPALSRCCCLGRWP